MSLFRFSKLASPLDLHSRVECKQNECKSCVHAQAAKAAPLNAVNLDALKLPRLQVLLLLDLVHPLVREVVVVLREQLAQQRDSRSVVRSVDDGTRDGLEDLARRASVALEWPIQR